MHLPVAHVQRRLEGDPAAARRRQSVRHDAARAVDGASRVGGGTGDQRLVPEGRVARGDVEGAAVFGLSGMYV